ncbi:MAG: enoyl-CoA hydratase [Myxococcota bacterium]
MHEPSNVRTELSPEGVLVVTLDRPEKKNAFTYGMYAACVAALARAAEDNQVRVVLFRGEGPSFTAGNDLSEFMQNPPKDENNPIFEFLFGLVDADKPIVAEVRGDAVGIGTTLLLHCDLVVAHPQSRFHMPFINLGLVPEGGSTLLLPRTAGMALASELLLLGEPFDASKAIAAGLVNLVVDEVEAVARARAEALAERPLESLMQSKRLLRGPLREALKETIRNEGRIFAQRLTSPEAMEAFTAFFERRKPDFRRISSN